MYHLIRPLLFNLEAETAHQLALKALHYLPASFFAASLITQPIKAMGLEFCHAIGLAAGFDKNGEYVDALSKLGFSFIEIGTVTPKPQAGNPKPRLFRIPSRHAIINRMGFNNQGVEQVVKNLKQTAYQGILGINIGKNKDTSLNKAVNDYVECLQKVYPYASYVTLNVSSPNTPDLRQLQQPDYLAHLLKHVTQAKQRLSDSHQREVPLVLKVSPDEPDDGLKQMAELALKHHIAGIIATNTTCSRQGVEGLARSEESGGLSGAPLLSRSTACLEVLKAHLGQTVTLIGSGGIVDVDSARQKRAAGADLLQIYTGFIYQGPRFIHTLTQGLADHTVST